MPHELTTNQKKLAFWSAIFSFYAATTNHFLIGFWCATKSGFYMTTSEDQLSGGAEKKLQSTSQSQICTRKWSWSLFGGLLLIWSSSAFWSPMKHYIWEVCSGNQWDAPKTATPVASIDQQNGPNSSPWQRHPRVTQPTLQKLNKLGYGVLPHPPHSPDLLPADYHFFKHLDNILQGKCFPNQQEAENAFPEFNKSRGSDFYTTGINQFISCWQKCVDCNGSYFDE